MYYWTFRVSLRARDQCDPFERHNALLLLSKNTKPNKKGAEKNAFRRIQWSLASQSAPPLSLCTNTHNQKKDDDFDGISRENWTILAG